MRLRCCGESLEQAWRTALVAGLPHQCPCRHSRLLLLPRPSCTCTKSAAGAPEGALLQTRANQRHKICVWCARMALSHEQQVSPKCALLSKPKPCMQVRQEGALLQKRAEAAEAELALLQNPKTMDPACRCARRARCCRSAWRRSWPCCRTLKPWTLRAGAPGGRAAAEARGGRGGGVGPAAEP